MRIDRRTFLAGGVVAAAGVASAGASASRNLPFKKAKLNISSQEPIIPGKDLPDRLAKMERWGFDGIEIWGSGLAGRVKEIRDALASSRVRLSAICSGYQGVLMSDDPVEREKAVRTMKDILAPAGELGATGMICVPAFNGHTKLENREGRKVLLDILPDLGAYAAKCGTRLLLEPLNRREAFFLRQLADAASICRDAGNPGVCMMGDFYHMFFEETSDLGAIISAGAYIHHMHVASRKRNLPGQDERDFTNGFRGLKVIGFQDYCSLECTPVGDPEKEIPKAVRFLRDQWAKA